LRAEAAGLSNVVFTGWLSGTEIAWALSVAWVGLAAYARAAPQGLPNKPFEYMSGSLPILSSLGGEARSLLERHGCGLTYRAGESADLVAALESLLADPARRDAMARASAAAFTANYSADVVIPEMADYVVGAAGSASGRERGAG
jgi:glycosyltransferase involved in cell wall biosynthesis